MAFLDGSKKKSTCYGNTRTQIFIDIDVETSCNMKWQYNKEHNTQMQSLFLVLDPNLCDIVIYNNILVNKK